MARTVFIPCASAQAPDKREVIVGYMTPKLRAEWDSATTGALTGGPA